MAVRLPDTTVSVRPTPSPGAAVASYDGGSGRAIASLGGALMEVGDAYEREQDAAKVFALRRQLDDWERQAVFDPDKGAINQTGSNSFGLGQRLLKDYDTLTGKLSQGLSQRQRMAFQELSTSRRAQIGDWAAKHEAKQRDAYEVGEYEADIASMRDRAALFPDKAATELAMMRQRIIGFGRARGMSTEQIDAAQKDAASGTHRVVIASLVNSGQVDAAAEYLKNSRTGMVARDLMAAEAGMREVVARGKAQAAADDVMARGLTATQALEEVRARFAGDPTTRDAAVTQVKTMFAERDAILARERREASDEAWKIITNGGSRKGIAPELWNRLGGEEQRQINDYLEQKWRRAKADAEGKDRPPDWGTFMMLADMARDQPDQFADPQTLLKYEPYLSKTQMGQLVALRSGMGKKDAKSAENILGAQKRVEALVQSQLGMAGIDTTISDSLPAGSAKRKAFDQWRGALFENITAHIDAGGKTDDQSLRQIGLNLLREGIEQGSGVGGFFQTRKRGYQMEAGKTYIAAPFDRIPLTERNALAEELVQTGQARRTVGGGYILNDAQRAAIERAYTRGVEQGRFR